MTTSEMAELLSLIDLGFASDSEEVKDILRSKIVAILSTSTGQAEPTDEQIMALYDNEIAKGGSADSVIVRTVRAALSTSTGQAEPTADAKDAAPLTLKQISVIAGQAQILFCLDKYASFEVAFARLIEAALSKGDSNHE